VSAGFREFSVMQNNDAIHMFDSCKAVRDYNHGFAD
jgi:hypothetical protein